MVVLLIPIAAGAPSLDPDSLGRLAELGITNLVLVRDEETVGLVLEGWAFDPTQSGRAALEALVDTRVEARTLRPLTQLAVSAVSNDRETDEGTRDRTEEQLAQFKGGSHGSSKSS